MSQIKFFCSHCKTSIETDDSMRGKVAACPACNTEITVPAVQKKQILVIPRGEVSPSPRSQTKKSNKLGIVIALLVGLALGYGLVVNKSLLSRIPAYIAGLFAAGPHGNSDANEASPPPSETSGAENGAVAFDDKAPMIREELSKVKTDSKIRYVNKSSNETPEELEKLQNILQKLEGRARLAGSDINEYLSLVKEYTDVLESTSSPYKETMVRGFSPEKVGRTSQQVGEDMADGTGSGFPVWQFPWMLRLKINWLKKEQWAEDGGMREVENIYAKYHRQRGAPVDCKEVIFDPKKYKGRVILTRVRMNGPCAIFNPIHTRDSTVTFACPKELVDKIRRANSAVGWDGLVNIKYWCDQSESNPYYLGVLLDIEI